MSTYTWFWLLTFENNISYNQFLEDHELHSCISKKSDPLVLDASIVVWIKTKEREFLSYVQSMFKNHKVVI